MSGWDSFFVAGAGAAAALTGLLFVGVALNLERILADAWLPGRALEPLVLLLTALVVSMLILVPGQSPRLLGAELLAIGLVNWLTITRIHWQGWRAISAPLRRPFIQRVLLAQAASVPYLLSGVTLIAQSEAGLYWVVPGVLGCFAAAVLSAWVLLIEINR